MKKSEWKQRARGAEEGARTAATRIRIITEENNALRKQVADMREHWRPIPIPHDWTPRDQKCILCDDPKDAPRHNS